MQTEQTQTAEKCCLLFTDIEGSTELIQSHGDVYPEILSKHYELLRNAIRQRDGQEVRTFGDSIFAVFPKSDLGVQAAIDAQRALHEENWAHGGPLKVRMGLHNGVVHHHEDELLGIEVHRAARIGSVAHGGQIVISSSVRDDIKEGGVRTEVRIRDLGYHRLKDLRYPELLFDLEIPGLPHEFDRISSVAANRSNLPSDIEKLFGREDDVDEIKSAILSKQRRLVTLTGTGGTGKTSLAMIVGKALQDSYPRGVFLVQLGDVDGVDLVAPAISQALGIHEQPGVSALDSIRTMVGDSELLLILDTFEHVIDGAGVVTGLLADCPNLSVIVTSREALRVRSETEYPVEPLAVPAPDAGFEEIAACDSVQLFLRFGSAERPDLQLTSENAEPIAAICRRLDGLPLAVELAASRLRLLEPHELAERLMKRLSDLSSRSRDLEPRHRTLYSTIEWSDNLLTERERQSFYKLSVFSGGFDLTAAGAVLGEIDNQDAVLEDSESLVSKSLLLRSVELGRPRLDMLDTIRQYANDELKNTLGEGKYRERHALYFTDLSELAAPKILKLDQRNYVEMLFQELGNIRVALRYLVEQPSAAETARMLEALKWFWISRGLFSEALNWIELALRQVRGLEDRRSLAAVLDVTGWIRYISGDAEGALEPSEQSYRLYQELGDPAGVASSGIIAGIAKAIAGQVPEGPALIFESLEQFRALGDQYGTAVALLAIGEGTRAEGDEPEAEKYYREALELLAEIQDTFWPGLLLQNLAHFRLHEGDWKAAAELAVEALSYGERYDYPIVVCLSVAAAGGVYVARGDAARCARILGAVEAQLKGMSAQFEPTDQADVERVIAAAREALGDREYEGAAADGALAPWEDVLSVARLCHSEAAP